MYLRNTLSLILLLFMVQKASGQDTSFHPKHAVMFFPYPMYKKERWRSSIGFQLLTTPEDITEETRIRLPVLDWHGIKRISDHVTVDGRLLSQVLQNHLSVGLHWMKPITKNLYLSAGNDIGYWFGFLKFAGFNSEASGWINYPNFSVGYKTNRELLITFKAQCSINLFYKSANGTESFSSSNTFYNGETFTLALEQPFYNKKHLTLAFSGISNKFLWQTWALFYKTDRKLFYPQITVGFIL
ncbi:MAG: hypothetical protein JWP81_3081 [Ferruginibacter sp.]|nr:hypothetical protein [Ferruginibacter sp.]